MLSNFNEPKEAREIMLSLLPTSGTLAGLSIGLMSVANMKTGGAIGTIADDLFLFSGVGFLTVCYQIFFALRRVSSERLPFWVQIIDFTFLASLTLVVVSGFLVIYEFIH